MADLGFQSGIDKARDLVSLNESWKEMNDSWQAMMDFNSRLRQSLAAESVDDGDGYADLCNRAMTQENNLERTRAQISRIRLNSGDSVLDIGAGTGRLAVPIAKRVRKVTAIEPSARMAKCLRGNMLRAGAENITIVKKRWEDVEVGGDIAPHDIVIASCSLSMSDMPLALKKLNQAATRAVYILTSALRWCDDGLWRAIYGEQQPKWWLDYIYINGLLCNMDIYANTEITESHTCLKYDSLEEAAQEWNKTYFVPPGREAETKNYLSRISTRAEGKILINRRNRSALIWWRKDGAAAL